MPITSTAVDKRKVQQYVEDISGRINDTAVQVAGHLAVVQGITATENVVLFPEKEPFIRYLGEKYTPVFYPINQ